MQPIDEFTLRQWKLGHDPMEEDAKATAAAVAEFLPTEPPPPLPAAPAATEPMVPPAVIPEKD